MSDTQKHKIANTPIGHVVSMGADDLGHFNRLMGTFSNPSYKRLDPKFYPSGFYFHAHLEDDELLFMKIKLGCCVVPATKQHIRHYLNNHYHHE